MTQTMTVRAGTDAPEYPPNNEDAVRFINGRLAEKLNGLIHQRHGEVVLRIAAVDGKLKLVEFSSTEKHKF